MRNLIKKILLEYSDEDIQTIKFNGFSEPFLVPQFNKYLVSFKGTGKIDKISDSEKIIFIDENGKEYMFDSNDVHKSGSSPFYISLDVLRRRYDVKFKDNFVRHKEKLSNKEYFNKLKEALSVYASPGKCNNPRCSEFRDVVEKSLKDLYPNNYGTFDSYGCPKTEGFLNIYPVSKDTDNMGNKWSKLNYIIFKENATSSIIMTYLKKYGTFEHGDFLKWIDDDKQRLFTGPFLELMLRNIMVRKDENLGSEKMMSYIENIFPDATLMGGFCPTTRKDYNELLSVLVKGKLVKFQPVNTKTKYVLKHNGKYYLQFSRREKSPIINRSADYIITNDGTIFENSKVVTGQRAWEFENPPIYNEYPYQTELKKFTKIK